jgi:hypothetical protein
VSTDRNFGSSESGSRERRDREVTRRGMRYPNAAGSGVVRRKVDVAKKQAYVQDISSTRASEWENFNEGNLLISRAVRTFKDDGEIVSSGFNSSFLLYLNTSV